MNAPEMWRGRRRATRDRFCKSAGGLLLAWSLVAPLLAEESVKLEKMEITARQVNAARERLPVGTTAYSGDFMAANGIADYRELARVVPGLFVTEQSVDNVSLNLRGLTSDTGDPRQQPRVSVFQDGVILGNAHGNGVAIFDVADVAIFKGPQPAQFGRGVEGGAIAFGSRRAVNANSGELALGFGDYRAASAEVTVNRVIVAGKFFARVAVQALRRDGYVTNLADGSDLQGEGRVAVRTSLRWEPVAGTTADLIFNYQRDHTPSIGLKSAIGVPGLPPIDTNPYTATNLNRGSVLGVGRTILGLTSIVKQKLGDAWTLTATSAWREVESANEFDVDGSPYYLLEPRENFSGRQVSQELRLNYDRGGSFTAAVGAGIFYSRDTQTALLRTDENTLWTFITHTPPPVVFNRRYGEENFGEGRLISGDVVGRADYKLSDRLTLGGGGRLTQEGVDSRYQSFPAPVRGNLVGLAATSGGTNDFFKNTDGQIGNSGKFGSWSGQTDARYALNPQLSAYVTVSRGRRTPLLDFKEITLARQKHAEETVWNYEAGFRGASAGGHLRYDASVFQYEFEHFQTQRVVAPGVTAAFDGGRARGRGFEATLHAEPMRALTAFATYGFTDARFLANGGDGAPQLYAGNTFRLTSRHVVSLGGTATRTLAGGGAVYLTPLFTYRSEYYFEDNNAQNGGILRQGGFGLMNLRLGYRAPGGRWEVIAYATNLLGKNYLLDAGNAGGAYGIPTNIAAAPRLLSVKTSVRF